MELFASLKSALMGIHPLVYASVAGAVYASISNFKILILRLTGLLIERVYLPERLMLDFKIFLQKEAGFKRSWVEPLRVVSEHAYYVPILKSIRVLYIWQSSPGNQTLWRYGFIPILCTQTTSNSGDKSSQNKEYGFSCIRWTINLSRLLEKFQKYIVDTSSNSQDKFYVKIEFGSRNASMHKEKSKKMPVEEESIEPYEEVSTSPLYLEDSLVGRKDDTFIKGTYFSEKLSLVEKEIEFFVKSKTWFQERSLTWKRGYLLYGKPGTGKTTFARAIAQKYSLPLYIFNLSSFYSQEFSERWNRIVSLNNLCIILIEDIDAVFNGRENVTNIPGSEPGITFDILLNTIDGAGKESGVILMISTNMLEKVDSALYQKTSSDFASRPGRIDRSVEFGNLDEEGRRVIAKRILKGFEEEIENFVSKYNDITPAQFEEVCKSHAMLRYEKDLNSKFKEVQ